MSRLIELEPGKREVRIFHLDNAEGGKPEKITVVHYPTTGTTLIYDRKAYPRPLIGRHPRRKKQAA